MKPSLGTGMVGYKFIGKSHANAYRQINQFFDLPCIPRLITIVGREETKVARMAERWEEIHPYMKPLPVEKTEMARSIAQ